MKRAALGLICGLALAGGATADLPLRAARWLARGVDPAQALGTVAAECLRPSLGGKDAYLVEVGRAAFRTPLLLGGQAARVGVACETCHQNGRANPDFQFPGLSGAPGTADVTTALFSAHRDDGIDNPIPIPDLGGPKSRLKVPQDAASGALERFIHGQITEEFEGAEPPRAVLRGLAAYVRALSPKACPAEARQPLRPADLLADAARAVRAALMALDHGDAPTAVLMTQAARSRLGLIHERYDQPDAASARAFLLSADADLAAALVRLRAGDPAAREALELWFTRLPQGAARLAAAEPGSLFNPARLAAARTLQPR